MTDHRLTRRTLIGAVLAAPLALPPARAFAQGAPAAFRAVSVDLSRLESLGSAAAATGFGGVLLATMRTVFADRISGDRRGPVLVARITNLYFTIYDDIERGYSLGHSDNIEGDGIVLDGGRVLSSTHILTELSPTYSGSRLYPGIDAARYQSIAYQFAYWLRREMNI